MNETTLGQLSSEDLGHRIVIRSKEKIGTVCGTLLEAAPHPTIPTLVVIHLLGQRPYVFRENTETVVVRQSVFSRVAAG